MKPFFVLSAVALMAACSTEALLDAAYGDRAKFQFQNADGDTLMSYACADSGDAQETQSRARAAHAYLDANIDATVDRAVEQMFEDDSAATLSGSVAIAKQIEAQMEFLVEQTEQKYRCVLYDTKEI